MRLGVLVLIAVTAPAGDWTRFRGPNGSGVSDAKNLPVKFGPTENLLWKTPLPEGHSSPIIGGNRIFVTALENESLVTIGLDRASGKILWKRAAPRTRQDPLKKPNHPASPSPVTDGGNVYVFFQDFGLLSYTANGRERWRLPLGPFQVYYGFGASPVVVEGNVILPVDQDTGSYLVAVDKDTGRVKWKVQRPGVISGYSTPVVAGKQLLIAESFQLSAYSAATGEREWFVQGLACEMKAVPVMGDGVLYINGWGWPENQPGRQIALQSFDDTLKAHDRDGDGAIAAGEMPHERLKHPGYFQTFDIDRNGRLNRAEWEITRAMMAAENGLLAIRMGGKGDMTASAIQWKYQRPVPQVPSTILYRGVLFMVNDSGILISFDPATGRVIRQDRLKGAIDKYFASPIAADGRLWLVSQDGTVSVVAARGEWEVEEVNSLGDEVYATPAVAEGRIYVRTRTALHCFARKRSTMPGEKKTH